MHSWNAWALGQPVAALEALQRSAVGYPLWLTLRPPMPHSWSSCRYSLTQAAAICRIALGMNSALPAYAGPMCLPQALHQKLLHCA